MLLQTPGSAQCQDGQGNDRQPGRQVGGRQPGGHCRASNVPDNSGRWRRRLAFGQAQPGAHVQDRGDGPRRQQGDQQQGRQKLPAAGQGDHGCAGGQCDRPAKLRQELAALPAQIEADLDQPQRCSNDQRREDSRPGQGERQSQPGQGNGGIDGGDSLGHARPREPPAAPPVRRRQLKGVAGQESASRRQSDARAGERGRQQQPEDQRLRQEAPAAMLVRDGYGFQTHRVGR